VTEPSTKSQRTSSGLSSWCLREGSYLRLIDFALQASCKTRDDERSADVLWDYPEGVLRDPNENEAHGPYYTGIVRDGVPHRSSGRASPYDLVFFEVPDLIWKHLYPMNSSSRKFAQWG
jgi:hypothetical protein